MAGADRLKKHGSHQVSILNPIPTSHRRNQPIYECHVTTAGRNRVKDMAAKRDFKTRHILFESCKSFFRSIPGMQGTTSAVLSSKLRPVAVNK